MHPMYINQSGLSQQLPDECSCHDGRDRRYPQSERDENHHRIEELLRQQNGVQNVESVYDLILAYNGGIVQAPPVLPNLGDS